MQSQHKVTRRNFLKSCSFAAGAFALTSSAVNGQVQIANSNAKVRLGRKLPNVIHILADDLGYGDLGCYGQKKIKTPNIDKLAAEGMKFTQHYAGNTVCAPSRCVLLTGLHSGHSFIRDNYEINGYQLALPAGTKTVGHLFQDAGYKTCCIGKWGLGGPDSTGTPAKMGFQHFFGYLGQVQAHSYYPDHLWRNSDQIPLGGTVYSHDLMTKEALWFINKYKDQPFFLHIPYTIPHTKFQVPELGEYANTDWASDHKIQAAMISRMDRDIGTIMELLKKQNIDNDTIVIFTSDNGPHAQSGTGTFFDANGPLRGIKRDLYEGGIRDPFVIRWPGKVKPGVTTDHISTFWDFLPTCADLLGVKCPKVKWSDGTEQDTDGISYLPTILGKSGQKQHEYLYWEFKARKTQAVRQGKWKLVRKSVNTENPISELYDLDADLGESNNIASANPAKVAELEQIASNAHILNPYFKILYGE
ncbi:MAG: arylsulfatase [Phycisphaerae bacterium]|nr:arylsulfatase [Phycisphaerae bacterium]